MGDMMKKCLKKLIDFLEEKINEYEIEEKNWKSTLDVISECKDGNPRYAVHLASDGKTIKNMSEVVEFLQTQNLNSQKIREKINTLSRLREAFGRLYQFLMESDEELKNDGKYIDSFHSLSVVFELASFKDYEIFEIIKEVVRRIAKTDIITNKSVILDAYKISNFPFQSVTLEEREFYLKKGAKFLLYGWNELDEKGKAFVNEILNSLEELVISDHTASKEALMKCVEILLHKENTYVEEDIETLLESLGKLELSEENLLIVKRCLTIGLEKRRKKEEKQIYTSMSSSTKYSYTCQTKTKHYITEEEYKKLRKRLKSCYDSYERVLKKELSYDEMIEIASIMIRLGNDKFDVCTFLKLAQGEMVCENTIASFIKNYNKYLYYLGEEATLDICEYLKEMMIATDEDYAFWKREAEQGIRSLNAFILDKADYEYQLAKKM